MKGSESDSDNDIIYPRFTFGCGTFGHLAVSGTKDSVRDVHVAHMKMLPCLCKEYGFLKSSPEDALGNAIVQDVVPRQMKEEHHQRSFLDTVSKAMPSNSNLPWYSGMHDDNLPDGLVKSTSGTASSESFVCGVCSLCFTQRSGMVMHICNDYGEYEYRCDLCPKVFDEKCLDDHKKMHGGSRKHPGLKCFKLFSHKSHLKQHSGGECGVCAGPSSSELRRPVNCETSNNKDKLVDTTSRSTQCEEDKLHGLLQVVAAETQKLINSEQALLGSRHKLAGLLQLVAQESEKMKSLPERRLPALPVSDTDDSTSSLNADDRSCDYSEGCLANTEVTSCGESSPRGSLAHSRSLSKKLSHLDGIRRKRRKRSNLLAPGSQLFEFVLQLLDDPQHQSVITWTRREHGEFRVCQPEVVARLWGKVKNKSDMTYDSLSRSLRHYYKQGILCSMSKKMHYQFTQETLKTWYERIGRSDMVQRVLLL